MHEFALTQNLLDRALKDAQSKHILSVNLLIGSFSDEREDSIRFYWNDLAKGSAGEGAEIHFDHVEAEMKCWIAAGCSISMRIKIVRVNIVMVNICIFYQEMM
jgi:hydrogenase nickel incorporation protein HypA/HybF